MLKKQRFTQKKKLKDIIDFLPKTDIKIGINKFVDLFREYLNKW